MHINNRSTIVIIAAVINVVVVNSKESYWIEKVRPSYSNQMYIAFYE